MLPGLRRAVWVGLVGLLVVLAVPAATLANGGSKCNASACKVYTEGPGTAGSGKQQGPTSGSGQSTTTVKQLPVPPKTSHLLSHAGKDGRVLSVIIRNPAYGTKRGLQETGLGPVASPSALGAAFDLGFGPTVLLAFLVGTAAAVAIQGGVRSRRRRRSSS